MTTARGSAQPRLPVPFVLLVGAALGVVAAAGPASAQEPNRRDFLTEYRDSLTAAPDPKSLSARGRVYVPTYSSIRGRTDQPGNLGALLRIDNTSSTKPLVLERIDRFDTSGKQIRRYLDKPVALKPFGTIQIFIAHGDMSGGPSAHFIVNWAGSGPIAEPLIEAVMFGKVDGEGYSFVSAGRPIRTVGKRQWFNLGR